LWEAARRALGQDEVAALWLHYVEEMPVAEIAAVLDRSRVAVKTMMFRARKKLLPLVGDLEP
jgi:DNA-directed RNA polymerase specialized sigma24 family protein